MSSSSATASSRTTRVVFFGKSYSDFGRFFFAYETAAAFEYYYEIFAFNRSLTEVAGRHGDVKAHFMPDFAKKNPPEEDVRLAVPAVLDPKDVTGSLDRLGLLYHKAGFNDKASFELLRNAEAKFPEMSIFAMYRLPSDCMLLKEAIMEFEVGRQAFFVADEGHSVSSETG
ncbi:hypothetical protein FGB62_167g016 [Gracilaria domingensis]|nr:hypothetical protein FGB62_167g016 [Gracilaria domingensis]